MRKHNSNQILVSFEINLSSESEETPLHYAMIQDKPEIVELLVQLGADANKRTIDGWYVYHVDEDYYNVRKESSIIRVLFSPTSALVPPTYQYTCFLSY